MNETKEVQFIIRKTANIDSLKVIGNRFFMFEIRMQLKMAVRFAVLVSFVQNVNYYKK